MKSASWLQKLLKIWLNSWKTKAPLPFSQSMGFFNAGHKTFSFINAMFGGGLGMPTLMAIMIGATMTVSVAAYGTLNDPKSSLYLNAGPVEQKGFKGMLKQLNELVSPPEPEPPPEPPAITPPPEVEEPEPSKSPEPEPFVPPINQTEPPPEPTPAQDSEPAPDNENTPTPTAEATATPVPPTETPEPAPEEPPPLPTPIPIEMEIPPPEVEPEEIPVEEITEEEITEEEPEEEAEEEEIIEEEPEEEDELEEEEPEPAPTRPNRRPQQTENANPTPTAPPATPEPPVATAPPATPKPPVVEIVNAEAPKIHDISPATFDLPVGSPLHLFVEAESLDNGTLSYQWYINTLSDNQSGTALTNETLDGYECSFDAMGTYYYYVVVTNTNPAVNGQPTATWVSDVMQVTVLKDAEVPEITIQPSSVKANIEEPFTLSVAASTEADAVLSYQWYQNTVESHEGGTPIPGATDSSYTGGGLARGEYYYYVIVTSTNPTVNGNQQAFVISDVITLKAVDFMDGLANGYDYAYETYGTGFLQAGYEKGLLYYGTAGMPNIWMTHIQGADWFVSDPLKLLEDCFLVIFNNYETYINELTQNPALSISGLSPPHFENMTEALAFFVTDWGLTAADDVYDYDFGYECGLFYFYHFLTVLDNESKDYVTLLNEKQILIDAHDLPAPDAETPDDSMKEPLFYTGFFEAYTLIESSLRSVIEAVYDSYDAASDTLTPMDEEAFKPYAYPFIEDSVSALLYGLYVDILTRYNGVLDQAFLDGISAGYIDTFALYADVSDEGYRAGALYYGETNMTDGGSLATPEAAALPESLVPIFTDTLSAYSESYVNALPVYSLPIADDFETDFTVAYGKWETLSDLMAWFEENGGRSGMKPGGGTQEFNLGVTYGESYAHKRFDHFANNESNFEQYFRSKNVVRGSQTLPDAPTEEVFEQRLFYSGFNIAYWLMSNGMRDVLSAVMDSIHHETGAVRQIDEKEAFLRRPLYIRDDAMNEIQYQMYRAIMDRYLAQLPMPPEEDNSGYTDEPLDEPPDGSIDEPLDEISGQQQAPSDEMPDLPMPQESNEQIPAIEPEKSECMEQRPGDEDDPDEDEAGEPDESNEPDEPSGADASNEPDEPEELIETGEPNEPSEAVIDDSAEEITEEVSEETADEAPEEASEETAEEAPEEVSEETTEEAPEEVSEETTEEAPEEVSEETAEDAPEGVTEEATEEHLAGQSGETENIDEDLSSLQQDSQEG